MSLFLLLTSVEELTKIKYQEGNGLPQYSFTHLDFHYLNYRSLRITKKIERHYINSHVPHFSRYLISQ